MFTRDRSILKYADLVVALIGDKLDDVPKTRPYHQRWVLGNYESPVHLREVPAYEDIFNYTATYKADSDYDGIYELSSSKNFS